MEKVIYPDVFEYPIEQFKRHLDSEFNEQIMFSGRYGSGKSSFLDYYFKPEHQIKLYGAVRYDVYRICPINYSIASNEDIMHYIKYDIILEMLKKKTLSIEQFEVPMSSTLTTFGKENSLKIISTLIYLIPKLGKEVVESFDKIDDLKNEYFKFHEEKSKSAEDRLVDFLEHVEAREGSLFEMDIISKIIGKHIGENKNTDSILIIDDLDRLDPEHVFRIFNVFATQFDGRVSGGKQNKFNFKKVIAVCDINNIKNLFHHRYGDQADFTGYIDKFYSHDIFSFDNKRAVNDIVSKILISMEADGIEPQTSKRLYLQSSFLQESLCFLVLRGTISIRALLKLHNKKLWHHAERLHFDKNNSDIKSYKLPIVLQLKVLQEVLGDSTGLKIAAEGMLQSYEYFDNSKHIFGQLIHVLAYREHGFTRRKKEYSFRYKQNSMVVCPGINFNTDILEHADLFEHTGIEKEGGLAKGNSIDADPVLLKTAVLDTIDLLKNIGFLY